MHVDLRIKSERASLATRLSLSWPFVNLDHNAQKAPNTLRFLRIPKLRFRKHRQKSPGIPDNFSSLERRQPRRTRSNTND